MAVGKNARGVDNEPYAEEYVKHYAIIIIGSDIPIATMIFYYATPPPPAERCTTGSDHDFIQISPSAAL